MAKVVLITGGSSGIGKAIGEYLNNKGFTVYGTSRNPENYKGKCNFPLLSMDVVAIESIQAAVEDLISREGRIDVLVNNAGVGISGPIEETPNAEIKKAFDTNVFGPINVIKAVLPQMRAQGCGHIVNITSIAGYMGLPYRGIYSATKAALEIITEALRMELHQFGIQLTNVAPGDFATNIAAGRYHVPLQKESPYHEAYSGTLKLMNEHVDRGEDPMTMAKAIYKIIETKNPKIHYKVGAPLQKLSIVLKRILPDKLYEKMLLNHFKLK